MTGVRRFLFAGNGDSPPQGFPRLTLLSQELRMGAESRTLSGAAVRGYREQAPRQTLRQEVIRVTT